MAASIRNKILSVRFLGGIAALSLLFAMGACALKESTSGDDDGGGGPGVVITVNDSTDVLLDFTDATKPMFSDSGEFDLDAIRAKMEDKGLDPATVEITGIVVTYDDSTKDFLADNKGVKFSLKIFIREDGGSRKLALSTMETDSEAFKVLAFDPDQALFELNKHIFGSPEGFPGFLDALKNNEKHKVMCIAELTLKETLKKTGSLKLNMVVTVSGK